MTQRPVPEDDEETRAIRALDDRAFIRGLAGALERLEKRDAKRGFAELVAEMRGISIDEARDVVETVRGRNQPPEPHDEPDVPDVHPAERNFKLAIADCKEWLERNSLGITPLADPAELMSDLVACAHAWEGYQLAYLLPPRNLDDDDDDEHGPLRDADLEYVVALVLKHAAPEQISQREVHRRITGMGYRVNHARTRHSLAALEGRGRARRTPPSTKGMAELWATTER